jgi:hypothetical protein
MYNSAPAVMGCENHIVELLLHLADEKIIIRNFDVSK